MIYMDKVHFTGLQSALKGMDGVNSEERFFEGLLTVQMKDKQGEVTIVDELYKVLPVWMDRGAPITDTHSNRVIGKGINYALTSARNSEGDLLPAIKITGKIYKNYELDNLIWDKIKNGEYKGLSFGGATRSQRTPMKMKDGSMAYALKDLEHYEVAVCKDPAVPMAIITDVNSIAKADFNATERGDGKMVIRCSKMGCFVEKSNIMKACANCGNQTPTNRYSHHGGNTQCQNCGSPFHDVPNAKVTPSPNPQKKYQEKRRMQNWIKERKHTHKNPVAESRSSQFWRKEDALKCEECGHGIVFKYSDIAKMKDPKNWKATCPNCGTRARGVRNFSQSPKFVGGKEGGRGKKGKERKNIKPDYSPEDKKAWKRRQDIAANESFKKRLESGDYAEAFGEGVGKAELRGIKTFEGKVQALQNEGKPRKNAERIVGSFVKTDVEKDFIEDTKPTRPAWRKNHEEEEEKDDQHLSEINERSKNWLEKFTGGDLGNKPENTTIKEPKSTLQRGLGNRAIKPPQAKPLARELGHIAQRRGHMENVSEIARRRVRQEGKRPIKPEGRAPEGQTRQPKQTRELGGKPTHPRSERRVVKEGDNSSVTTDDGFNARYNDKKESKKEERDHSDSYGDNPSMYNQDVDRDASSGRKIVTINQSITDINQAVTNINQALLVEISKADTTVNQTGGVRNDISGINQQGSMDPTDASGKITPVKDDDEKDDDEKETEKDKESYPAERQEERNRPYRAEKKSSLSGII